MGLDPNLTLYTKINSKWIIGLNVGTKTVKLLEENIGIHLDFGLGNDFLDTTPKAQANKQKINKIYLIKIKNFCASKDTIKKVKRQNAVVAAVGNSLAIPQNVKLRITIQANCSTPRYIP